MNESTYRVLSGSGEVLATFGCAACVAGRSVCECVIEAFQDARRHGNGTHVMRGDMALGHVWSKAYGSSPILSRHARLRARRLAA